MALEVETNGNVIEDVEEDDQAANMDLRMAELNTHLLVATQFLQRCSGKLNTNTHVISCVKEGDQASNMDLRMAELNTHLLVATQFLQRCSGRIGIR